MLVRGFYGSNAPGLSGLGDFRISWVGGDFFRFFHLIWAFLGFKNNFHQEKYDHQIRRPRVVLGGAWGRGVMTTAGFRAGTCPADIALREFF